MADTAAAVCVFCGSRFGADPAFVDLAREVGRGLAERGLPLIYGGGDVGLMGTVADAVMRAGGEVHGYIPERLMDLEVGKRDITSLEVTPDMFVRKRAMIERSAAFVALPGGLGTLDEILDAITLRQLGYHAKPVLLVGPAAFWQPFVALISHIVSHGFASAAAGELYAIVEQPAGLWQRFEQAGVG